MDSMDSMGLLIVFSTYLTVVQQLFVVCFCMVGCFLFYHLRFMTYLIIISSLHHELSRRRAPLPEVVPIILNHNFVGHLFLMSHFISVHHVLFARHFLSVHHFFLACHLFCALHLIFVTSSSATAPAVELYSRRLDLVLSLFHHQNRDHENFLSNSAKVPNMQYRA